jgi:plasmid stabilization system protein ParE
MQSRFHDAADAELLEAISYYDARVDGLGDRFLAEVMSATRYIERYPEIAPVIEEGVRAKVLSRFPYTLMYIVDESEIFILAVAHQSRRPAYWADRARPHPS